MHLVKYSLLSLFAESGSSIIAVYLGRKIMENFLNDAPMFPLIFIEYVNAEPVLKRECLPVIPGL